MLVISSSMKTKQLIILTIAFFIGGLLNNTSAQSTDDTPVIPNVFTPNNDGVNDSFKIDVSEGSWELMIFDRWGSLVFASQQGQGTNWNGVNLQGIKADEGVYFYTLSDEISGQTYKGSLHLFR